MEVKYCSTIRAAELVNDRQAKPTITIVGESFSRLWIIGLGWQRCCLTTLRRAAPRPRILGCPVDALSPDGCSGYAGRLEQSDRLFSLGDLWRLSYRQSNSGSCRNT